MKTRSIACLGLAALGAACAGTPATPEGPLPGGRTARFDVRHAISLDVPENAGHVRVWMALPQEHDPAQTISNLEVAAPFEHRVTTDSEGNQFLFLEAVDPPAGKAEIVTEFQVTRRETRYDTSPEGVGSILEAQRPETAKYLQPNENVVIDDTIRDLSRQIVGEETNPLVAARRIYDWELDNVDYWVKYPDRLKASPVGSSSYCLTNATGNCTDFHSLYAALARSAGIPTQIVYGSFFKKPLDGQDQDQSYHCWIVFYAPGRGWVPLDVAVADLYVGDFPSTEDNRTKVDLTLAAAYEGPDPALVDYYFGNLEERRVTWNVGRDILLDPPPAQGRLNAVPKAFVEIDGKAVGEKAGWTRKLTFREL